MKLKFDKRVILFRINLSHKTICNNENFYKLCQRLKRFPLLNPSINIKGLFLSGDYFFKKIAFSEIQDVTFKEIPQINSIIPIFDHNELIPYDLSQETFELNIPTENRSTEEISSHLAKVNRFLENLIVELDEDRSCPQIEIHIPGQLSSSLFRKIIKDAVTQFPRDSYTYEALIKNNKKTGQLDLPSNAKMLPADIKQLVDNINPQNYLRLSLKNKLFVLKQVKRSELGISIFSDELQWFDSILSRFDKAGLFVPKTEPTPDFIKEVPIFA